MTARESNPHSAKSIFFAAIDIEDHAQRSVYLDEICRGDDDLRREVEQLLTVEPALNGNLLCQAVERFNPHLMDGAADGESLIGTTRQWIDASAHPVIGRYKVLEEIGRGGMGRVYMAQQLKPVKRRVALKVINPGMDSREVVARFEAESQALALMDHPNIARVLDAGTTSEERPYFVMELVRGVPITEYCQQHQLGLDERLQLFIDVCHALQHAHQKGIIHRDIKPSNVMVSSHDGVPVVKVIDFGVAKALHQDLTDNTLFTQFSQIVGTPVYMSPEQAGLGGLDVDTRSDIYSLGVLLYELLTGTPPFDREMLAQAGVDGARRIICEQEPLRPSIRLSTLEAAQDSTINTRFPSGAKHLALKLCDELDWIVMKALEKDRTRRYESVIELTKDARRYLDDEPVEACPPSTAYRLKKFAKRNKTAASTVVAVALALLLGASIAATQAVRATKAERLAKQQERLAVEQQKLAQEAANRERQLTAEANSKREEAERQRQRAESVLMLSMCDFNPAGIAFGPNGNMYVSGCGIDQILEFDGRTGYFVGVYVGAGSGGLRQPQGLVFGPDANEDGVLDLYVASGGSNAVLCFDGTTGDFLEQLVSPEEGGLVRPTGLTFDANDSLYVTSHLTNSVLRYDRTTGKILKQFIPSGRGGLHGPQMARFGPDGNLYVASFASLSVLRYDGKTGKFLDEFVTSGSGGLNRPQGLAFGPDGNLYVISDPHGNASSVLRYDGGSGAFMGEFISRSTGGLVGARDLIFGPEGNVYVTSFWTNTVARYDGVTGKFLNMFVTYDRRFLLESEIHSSTIRNALLRAYLTEARARLYMGNLKESLPYFLKVKQLQYKSVSYWYFCALAHLKISGADSYRDICRAMVELFREDVSSGDGYWIAWTCTLGPKAVDDYLPVVRLAEIAAETVPVSVKSVATLGAIRYRAGQAEEAIKQLTEAISLMSEPHTDSFSSPTYSCYFLAMAHHRRGNTEQALAWFTKANEYALKELATGEKTSGRTLSWNRQFMLELLHKEAAQLLGVDVNHAIRHETEQLLGTPDAPPGDIEKPNND